MWCSSRHPMAQKFPATSSIPPTTRHLTKGATPNRGFFTAATITTNLPKLALGRPFTLSRTTPRWVQPTEPAICSQFLMPGCISISSSNSQHVVVQRVMIKALGPTQASNCPKLKCKPPWKQHKPCCLAVAIGAELQLCTQRGTTMTSQLMMAPTSVSMRISATTPTVKRHLSMVWRFMLSKLFPILK